MVPTNDRFLVDLHLGKLARTLRLLGFDAVYSNKFTPVELLALARSENRVLLSRNAAIAKDPTVTALAVESEDYREQTGQVLRAFHLERKVSPFSRCIVCNGNLQRVPKPEIGTLLEENTRLYYREFWQCAGCKKVFWKGPHYERMRKLLQDMGIPETG